MPDELHRKLRVRAPETGARHCLLGEVEQMAERPTLVELMDRLGAEEPVEVDEPPEVTIRRLRKAG